VKCGREAGWARDRGELMGHVERKRPESWAPAYNSRNGCGGQIPHCGTDDPASRDYEPVSALLPVATPSSLFREIKHLAERSCCP